MGGPLRSLVVLEHNSNGKEEKVRPSYKNWIHNIYHIISDKRINGIFKYPLSFFQYVAVAQPSHFCQGRRANIFQSEISKQSEMRQKYSLIKSMIKV